MKLVYSEMVGTATAQLTGGRAIEKHNEWKTIVDFIVDSGELCVKISI